MLFAPILNNNVCHCQRAYVHDKVYGGNYEDRWSVFNAIIIKLLLKSYTKYKIKHTRTIKVKVKIR